MRLEHPVHRSFRCQRAADALDIDTAEKAVHELSITADLDTPYAVGLIVGASGAGKTTLARQIFGDAAFQVVLDLTQPVIEQFPPEWSYDQCAAALVGMGLTAVPCWIRPAGTLSTGQRARAEAALLLARTGADGALTPVIDEWTSVVDRTVAKVMSHCLQKHVRRSGARVVCCSCHYDVVDWLNPDWIIDCNRGAFHDRRHLWRDYQRSERLVFDIHEVDKGTWRAFSQYHYLSARLPAGTIYCYGLFHGMEQVGFSCFANYIPRERGKPVIYHSNRTVIHPDYAGLGLGIRFVTLTSAHMVARGGVRVMGKFSSLPMYRATRRDPAWRFLGAVRQIGRTPHGARLQRATGSFRENVLAYRFEYVGVAAPPGAGA